MRIFDETKTQELNENEIDREKGYLKDDKKFVQHHEAVEAKESVYKDRPEKLANGSTQVWKELITPAVEAKEAYDEYEDIQVYVPYTSVQLEEKRLNDLRKKREPLLIAFDKYKGNVQYGVLSETAAEHAEIIAWYKDLLDLKQSAFENIPSQINHYIV